MIRQTQGAGFKLAATAIIWGFATGMLGICIPLVSMTDSGVILPLAVIIGASFTTTVIWLSFNRVSINTVELSDNIESLKEQEATLDTMDNNEKFDDQNRIKLLEPRDNK
ncbi:MAG: hypothetical protein RIG63_08505 [Coleofasciculus chthonoplastes F3-SA18-01]|jgi:hypothetical protein|uniref:hypothetical protein n=1 Tax=Coleofasciculus chthonoplastes TaxID=64178 RepID=UPI0032FB9866